MFFYMFWGLLFDRFLIKTGIHLGTPLASNSMFLGACFVDDLLDGFLIDFDQKCIPFSIICGSVLVVWDIHFDPFNQTDGDHHRSGTR